MARIGPAWYVLASLLVAGCTGTGSGNCVNFFGPTCSESEPVPECRSWSTILALASSVSVDRAVVPALGDLRVGDRLRVGTVVFDRNPQYCGGPIDRASDWVTSSPSVLRADTTSFASAQFVAVAPGTAQVSAVMPAPGGGSRRVELSVCVDPSAAPNDTGCARIALTLHVLPASSD